MSSQKLYFLSWTDIEKICKQFVAQIASQKHFDFIIGIQRGGVVPSVVLSHMMDNRNIIFLDIVRTESSRVNSEKNAPRLNQNCDLSVIKNKKVLIVDDIVGEGTTLESAKRFVASHTPSEVFTSVCVINLSNWEKYNNVDWRSKINYAGKAVNGWVIFPWETYENEQ